MSTISWWNVRVLVLLSILAAPAAGHAQEAVLTGAVTDTTGAVLQGVTVTATNTATGNAFVAATDGTGAFRLPVRVGTYEIKSEISGFQTVVQSGVQMLLGRESVLSFKMAAVCPQRRGMLQRRTLRGRRA